MEAKTLDMLIGCAQGGFAVVVAVFLLVRMERQLHALAEAIQELRVAVEVLDARTTSVPRERSRPNGGNGDGRLYASDRART